MQANLVITNRCNFKCVHCSVDAGKGNYEIPLNKIKKKLDEFMQKKITDIDISGGEPFLRKDLVEIVRLVKTYGFNVKIHTNGSLITKKMLKELKNAQLDGFAISLDGLDYTIQKKIRPISRKVFDKIIKNLIIAKKFGFFVKINSVVFNSTMDALVDLNKFCIKNKLDEHRICYFLPIGRGRQIKNELVEPLIWLKFAKKNFGNAITKIGTVIANKYTKNIDCIDTGSCPMKCSEKKCKKKVESWFRIPKNFNLVCPIRKFSIQELS